MPAAGVLMAFLVVFCSAAQLLSLGTGFPCFVCVCVGMCVKVLHVRTVCVHMQCKPIDWDRRGMEQDITHISLSPHMTMCPSSFHVFLLSEIITGVFRDSSGYSLSRVLHIRRHRAFPSLYITLAVQ